MEIWHFSGGGAAQGTSTEIQTHNNQYIPSSEENAYYQRVREFILKERQAQLLGLPEDPTFQERMIKFAREGYDNFVAPLLPIALNDCAEAPAILSRALGCARQMALMGWDETEFKTEYEKIMETWEQVMINYRTGWKEWLLAPDPFYNCDSPYGLWDITYENALGQTYSYYIPFSQDGKSTLTFNFHSQMLCKPLTSIVKAM